VPPSPDRLGPALDNWEKYLYSEEKDRLVQLAVIKGQFEIIHPFLDGNGRMGRMLVPLFLYDKKLLSSPMFYLSAYLEAKRGVYFRWLAAISQSGDWDGWITFFLTAIVEQARVNIQKTREILDLYDRMKKALPRVIRSQYAVQAIDALFDRPIFAIADFVTRSRIPKDSARRIVRALKDSGSIRDLRPGRGRRAAILIFPELINIADG